MGDSDLSVIYKGNNGSYKLIGEIGSGGNGKVFDVEIVGDSKSIPYSQDGYVLKELMCKKDWKKRKTRFIREVNAVLKYQNQVKGMMPIYDYSLGEDNDKFWFIMPKASEYKYLRNTANVNLKHMLELGKIISKIHSLRCTHRDIKPDNILFFNNQLFLSDYGLIWEEDVSLPITGQGEHLGGFIIRPPEFEKYAYRTDNFEMFSASDVYLFAKTLWMVVSRKDHGFFGEYSRNDSSKCLKQKELSFGKTIEPLHCLMEGATKDNYLDRISIEECLEYINTQLQIEERTIPRNELDRLVYSERIAEVTSTVIPNEMMYTEDYSILKVITVFKNAADVVIDNAIHSKCLGKLTDIRVINDDVIIMEVRDSLGRKQFYISIEQVKIIGKDMCTCRLKPPANVSVPVARKLSEINEIEMINTKKVIVDSKLTLKLICPTA